MVRKRKLVILGIAGGLVVIGLGVTIALLVALNQPVEVGDEASDEGQATQEMTGLPPTNAEATALVDEAYAAQAAGDYDTGIKKLQEAKAIYEGEDIEMYASDIDMQIAIFEEQRAANAAIEAENQSPGLQTTGQ